MDLIIADNKCNKCNIMFHCLAGLGRAPTILSYLMMTRFDYGSKSKRNDIITEIRKKRCAFNSKQIKWIYNVKIKNNNYSGCKCVIM